uniref:Uncharacterized protein n=2 Tax=Nothobranchius korthausae TaxID=1143690 RepID=A0A1A8G072_9TELE
MDLNATLGSLVVFIWMPEIWAILAQERCTDVKPWFERVFSVPGDTAMLNSTLLSPGVLNYTAVPYNITWYNSKTGQEMSNQTGRILVLGETLWFLNTTLEDAGEYTTVLRTPLSCFMQSTKLVVDTPNAGECGRPQKTSQELTDGVADHLNCPLSEYIYKLESYRITSPIQWYKGCEPILDGSDKYTYWDRTLLNVKRVEPEDSGTYTCTLTFTLGGVTGSVSESINALIRDEYSLAPQVHEPTNEIIKAKIGSNLTVKCLVFVPGVGIPFVDVLWLVRDAFVFDTSPPANVYTSERRMWLQKTPQEGVWLERMLFISELKKEDFYINYTCQASSSRGDHEGYFTLLPSDPDILLPVGLVFCHVVVLFIVSVTVYYSFRIDIVLWFRTVFPFLYKNKDLDGKLYDAYVAYPQPGSFESGGDVERFALHTLPQILEQAYGYKLFIAGRDCLPGQATVDSVEENIQTSRRILLLYTASTFIGKKHTSSTSSNNNNVPISRANKSETGTSDSSVTSFYDDEKVFSDTRQPLESVAAMHRALLEGSLKVILVELEEISPDQLALFPESVRYLRKKQGAVCWWKHVQKRQTWRMCVRERDEEKHGQDSRLSQSLCPSSRFWKEIRFHMPVRGKRVEYPEKTALLNL